MKTYVKFFLRIYLSSFFYVFTIMFSLIFILNLLTELDFFKDLEVSTYFTMLLTLLNTPALIFEMFPFIFLISTQLFFNNLLNNNQINTLKYSGMKNSKIIIVITSLVFFMGILIITSFYNLSSNLKSYYLELKSSYTSDSKYLAVVTNNGLWIKDIVDDKILMINASQIDQNFILNGYISEFNKNFEIIRNIKSKKIDVSKQEWIIYNAEVFRQNNKENYGMLLLKTNFDYTIIQNLFSNLSSLSLLKLIEMRDNYKKLNYSLTDVNLQLLKLFSYPFYLVLMTLISSIIMLNTKNISNKYVKVTIGLFTSVIVYYIYNYFYVLGLTEKINLLTSISLPLIILMFINIYFLRNINAK